MYLYAYDPRSGIRDVGLRSNWGYSLRGIWRVFSRILKDRILDSSCETIITANEGVRGAIPLKENVDEAIKSCPDVHSVIVVHRADEVLNLKNSIDVDYFTEKEKFDAICDCEPMSAEDPLFILYTSGSTGKPKGVLHSTGGYLLGATLTHKYIFNYADNDIYCVLQM